MKSKHHLWVILLVVLVGTCLNAAEPYSWQKPQARMLPNGSLEWAPEPYEFVKGDVVYYIDYENGDDANAGTMRQAPWQHHPWDADATGKAAEAGTSSVSTGSRARSSNRSARCLLQGVILALTRSSTVVRR